MIVWFRRIFTFVLIAMIPVSADTMSVHALTQPQTQLHSVVTQVQVVTEWNPSWVAYANAFERDIAEWTTSLGVPAPQFVHLGNNQPDGCGTKISPTRAFFCGKDAKIYYTLEGFARWMYVPNVQFGAMGAEYTVGHETTHYLQFMAKSQQQSPYIEQQANCGSGVFIRWEMVNHSHGDVTHTAAQSLADTMAKSPRDEEHGDPRILQQAFILGYNAGSLEACTAPLAGAKPVS